MTVKELIEKLAAYPSNIKVRIPRHIDHSTVADQDGFAEINQVCYQDKTMQAVLLNDGEFDLAPINPEDES